MNLEIYLPIIPGAKAASPANQARMCVTQDSEGMGVNHVL